MSRLREVAWGIAMIHVVTLVGGIFAGGSSMAIYSLANGHGAAGTALALGTAAASSLALFGGVTVLDRIES